MADHDISSDLHDALRETRACAPLSYSEKDRMWSAIQSGMYYEPARKMGIGRLPELFGAGSQKMGVFSRYSLGRWVGYTALAAAGIIAGSVTKVWEGIKPDFNKSSDKTSLTREYLTKRGQQARLSLPDGTQVVLAPETKLLFNGTKTGARTVELTGQAYFIITNNVRSPFSVRTHGVTTNVLGTSFVIRAYPADRTTRVAVAEGKVSVSNGTAPVVLTAGEIGNIVQNAPVSVARDARISEVLGWIDGKIAFDNVPFREVIAELERVYDIDVEVLSDTLNGRPVTVVFTGKSVTDMIQVLSEIVGAKYVHRGSVVQFTLK